MEFIFCKVLNENKVKQITCIFELIPVTINCDRMKFIEMCNTSP